MPFGGCSPRFRTKRSRRQRGSISRDSLGVLWRQAPADVEHQIFGIVPPITAPPCSNLLGKIGGRLTAEWRVGGADTAPIVAVARRAGGNAAAGVAVMVKLAAAFIGRRARADRRGKRGIIIGNHPQLFARQFARYVFHAGIPAPAACICLELRGEVAGIDRGEARRFGTIALAIEPMTGEAGI